MGSECMHDVSVFAYVRACVCYLNTIVFQNDFSCHSNDIHKIALLGAF